LSLYKLSEVDSETLRRAVQDREPVASLSVLPMLFHELRHWLDHVATVWGRQRLVALFDAINARLLNDPASFWRIVHYRRLVNRDHFTEFFSTVETAQQPEGAHKQWLYQSSCGLRFDHDGRQDESSPIFFTRYAWSTGEMACRVPFSVAALLESSAMAFELAIRNAIVYQLPEGVRNIEEELTNQQWANDLYDTDLAKYSTAVHLIANRLNVQVAAWAFPLASALASLCLNLPEEMFSALRVPEEFHKWGDRNAAAIERRDRGYAFLLIAHHSTPDSLDQPRAWVESAAQAAGLPPLIEIESAARHEMQTSLAEAIQGPVSNRLLQLCEAGDQVFARLGIAPTALEVLDSLPDLCLPPVLCGADLQWRSLGRLWPIADPANAESWYDTFSTVHSQFREFLDVCGV